MALFHLSVTQTKRSAGQSAIASAAYRAGERLYSEYYGECSNNLNQVAIQANTYGAIYPEELAALQRDYAALWGPLSDLLKQLSALVEL